MAHENPGSGDGQAGGSLGALKTSPLAVSYPSPMMLFNYPLVVANVKVLCDKSGQKSKANSLAGTIRLLRDTYNFEGVAGLYRGAHLYLFHQALRDILRKLSEGCFTLVESRLGLKPFGQAALQDSQDRGEEQLSSRKKRFISRLAAKYCIDCVCYPVLLASTRLVVLRDTQENSWERLCHWCREEGLLSLFAGLAASIASTAVEEAMEMILAGSLEKNANIDMADKFVLKACGGSVVSVFTAPINYVGVIQRCQSCLPGLLEPKPLWPIIRGLPWRSSLNQLVLFSGVLALNVRVIQWKLQLQAEEEDDDE
eukprot:TRINITY_DN43196_c0_g1_i1.p1 TRINITY_DN43196_c0_g1~~TRINITY_DN43196_c0_g1_i1.p1  ORF type:complete len:322 (+),score=50.45 TRINITY_DN43196_c0_g1_i1:33-968(+)